MHSRECLCVSALVWGQYALIFLPAFCPGPWMCLGVTHRCRKVSDTAGAVINRENFQCWLHSDGSSRVFDAHELTAALTLTCSSYFYNPGWLIWAFSIWHFHIFPFLISCWCWHNEFPQMDWGCLADTPSFTQAQGTFTLCDAAGRYLNVDSLCLDGFSAWWTHNSETYSTAVISFVVLCSHRVINVKWIFTSPHWSRTWRQSRSPAYGECWSSGGGIYRWLWVSDVHKRFYTTFNLKSHITACVVWVNCMLVFYHFNQFWLETLSNNKTSKTHLALDPRCHVEASQKPKTGTYEFDEN